MSTGPTRGSPSGGSSRTHWVRERSRRRYSFFFSVTCACMGWDSRCCDARIESMRRDAASDVMHVRTQVDGEWWDAAMVLAAPSHHRTIGCDRQSYPYLSCGFFPATPYSPSRSTIAIAIGYPTCSRIRSDTRRAMRSSRLRRAGRRRGAAAAGNEKGGGGEWPVVVWTLAGGVKNESRPWPAAGEAFTHQKKKVAHERTSVYRTHAHGTRCHAQLCTLRRV